MRGYALQSVAPLPIAMAHLIADLDGCFGRPVPYVHFNLFENDRRMMRAGIAKATQVLRAAGATATWSVNRYAHLVGTCRMGFTPRDSVVDRWCRTWDVANLFVCDGSVLPTQGAANPAITISALAARLADWLRSAVPSGELAQRPTAAASRSNNSICLRQG